MTCYAGIICEQNLMLYYELDHLLGIWVFRLHFLPRPVRNESNDQVYQVGLVPSISLVDEYTFKAWAPLYII